MASFLPYHADVWRRVVANAAEGWEREGKPAKSLDFFIVDTHKYPHSINYAIVTNKLFRRFLFFFITFLHFVTFFIFWILFFCNILLRRRRNKNVTGGANKAYSAETHGVKI